MELTDTFQDFVGFESCLACEEVVKDERTVCEAVRGGGDKTNLISMKNIGKRYNHMEGGGCEIPWLVLFLE